MSPTFCAVTAPPTDNAKKEEPKAESQPLQLMRKDIFKAVPVKPSSSPLATITDSLSPDGTMVRALKKTTNRLGEEVGAR